MSLAKRFNPTPATEEIKEDLTGNVTTDTVETVVTPTEAAEPVVEEVPVEQTPVTTEPVDVVTSTDIITTDVTDTVSTAVEPEEVATVIEPSTPAEPIDSSEATTEEKVVETPVDTTVIEVHEESAAHSDVEVVENKVSDQTAVEVETDEDKTEEVEFLQTEITAGLEAICELENLASKLDKQETLGVAQEAYSDLALMVFNKIKTNLGLEEESSDEPVNSNKVKQFKDKIISAIKALWEKIKEIIKSIIKSFTDFGQKMKDNADKFLEQLTASINKKTPIVLETRKFFVDEDVVTSNIVFDSVHFKNYEHNFKKISNYVESLRALVINIDTNPENESELKELNELGNDLIDSLHSPDTETHDDSKFRKVTPDYYLGCVDGKIKCLPTGVVKVGTPYHKEQKMMPMEKEDLKAAAEFNLMRIGLINLYIEISHIIEKTVTFEIPRLIEKIKSKPAKDFESFGKNQFNINELNSILKSLVSIGIALNTYGKDLLSGPDYYADTVR